MRSDTRKQGPWTENKSYHAVPRLGELVLRAPVPESGNSNIVLQQQQQQQLEAAAATVR